MVSNFRRQMIIANNLANATTVGYKQDLTTFSDFTNVLTVWKEASGPGTLAASHPIGTLGTGAELEEISLDLSQGDLNETGNALDLAISGPGFFAIQTPLGTLYTRDGSFHRNTAGQVARADGGLLLGESGPLEAGAGDILVDGDGRVSVDGQVVGEIRLVEFGPQDRLLKLGGNYLAPEDPAAQERAAEGAAINQGFLERSNVDLMRASVEMLSAMRSYEASLKLVQLQDQTLERTVNEIGKV